MSSKAYNPPYENLAKDEPSGSSVVVNAALIVIIVGFVFGCAIIGFRKSDKNYRAELKDQTAQAREVAANHVVNEDGTLADNTNLGPK